MDKPKRSLGSLTQPSPWPRDPAMTLKYVPVVVAALRDLTVNAANTARTLFRFL
jgi:hypothetical protein